MTVASIWNVRSIMLRVCCPLCHARIYALKATSRISTLSLWSANCRCNWMSSLILGPLASNHWTSACPPLFLYTMKGTCEKASRTLKWTRYAVLFSFNLNAGASPIPYVCLCTLVNTRLKAEAQIICTYSEVWIVKGENGRSKGNK